MNTFDDKLYDVVQRVEQIKESIDGENGIQSKVEKIDELDTAINGEEGLKAQVEELKGQIEGGSSGGSQANTSIHILSHTFPDTGEVLYAILAPKTVGAHFKGLFSMNSKLYIDTYVTPSYDSVPDKLHIIYTITQNEIFASMFENPTITFVSMNGQEYLAIKFTSKSYNSTGCEIYCMEASHPEVVQWATDGVSDIESTAQTMSMSL